MSLGLILSHALVSELVELSVKGHLVVLEKKDWGGLGKDAGGGGGGAYSFVAHLSHLTIDHASRLRRSTVPTATVIETPPAFGCSLRFFLKLRETFRLSFLLQKGRHLSRPVELRANASF